MDLASPLRSLVPSLDSAVLEVLARTESGLGASRVARLARRGSRQGVTLALDRLVGHGLVVAEPANRGHLYRLNREHVLTDALLCALDVRSVVFARLEDALGSLDPAPVHAAVFGSFARADGTENSDIDLFLLTPHDHDTQDQVWREQLRELEARVLAWTGNRLECVVLSMDSLASTIRSQEPIVTSLLEDGIRLHGISLDQLVAELAPQQPTATNR